MQAPFQSAPVCIFVDPGRSTVSRFPSSFCYHFPQRSLCHSDVVCSGHAPQPSPLDLHHRVLSRCRTSSDKTENLSCDDIDHLSEHKFSMS